MTTTESRLMQFFLNVFTEFSEFSDTIWVKVEPSQIVPLRRGCRVQGNTPDFMLDHFIVHLSDDTRCAPPIGGQSLTVIAIQHCTLKAKQKYPAITLAAD